MAPRRADLMRMAFAAAGVGMYAFDRTGSLVVVNQAAADLLGWPADELVGRNAHETFHHTRSDGTAAPIADCRAFDVARSGVGDHDDADLFWRRDGRPLAVWWISSPMRATAGAPAHESAPDDVAGVVVFGDATERRARDVDTDVKIAAAELRREAAERAFREARAATDAAEAENARLTTLARLSELLNALTVLDGLDAVSGLVAGDLADGCIIHRVDAERLIHRVSVAGTGLTSEDTARQLRQLPPATSRSQGSLAQVLSGAMTQVVVDRTDSSARPLPDALDEAQATMFDLLGASHAVVVPLRSSGRVHGAMTWVRRRADDQFSATDLLVADLFGLRIGQWLENRRLHELQQDAAAALQRSLLTSLPEPGHLELVARYLPATEGVEVGGDWYDAFMAYDGHTVLAIGDVTGHDIGAATRMAQLRNMLRFAALHQPLRPAAALRAVDEAMPALDIPGLASVVIGAISRAAGDAYCFTWTNGGHPPPLVVHADATVQVLERPADLILGVDPAAPRQDHVVELPEGSTLVLYTDGLIERRGEDLDDGLVRLIDAAGSLAKLPLTQLCDGLLAALTPDAGPADDIAIIAARLHPQDRPRPVEAGPESVPEGHPAT